MESFCGSAILPFSFTIYLLELIFWGKEGEIYGESEERGRIAGFQSKDDETEREVYECVCVLYCTSGDNPRQYISLDLFYLSC